MRVALDTNILAYAEGVNGVRMKRAALHLLNQLPPAYVILSVQVLGELFRVLTRKAGYPLPDARNIILNWSNAFSAITTSPATILAATDLVVHHRFGFWDAVIVCAATEAGCSILLSEDMQAGFTHQGITIINPFTLPTHPLLKTILNQ